MPGPLSDKVCIVGVGETAHMRESGRTTFSMACEAVKKAILDAGLELKDVDGMTSYMMNDSTAASNVAEALGIQLNYGLDIVGGGSSGEALVAHAVGLIAGGYCKTMVIFRSMNGRSGNRMGGQSPTGPRATVAGGQNAWSTLAGMTTPAQGFGNGCMRHMADYGTTSRDLGAIAVAHRKHATLNPKALMKTAITIEDHQNSRWVSKPFRLLDCCQETDVCCALVLTSAAHAFDLRHTPVFVKGGTARTLITGEGPQLSRPQIHYVAGQYGRKRVFGMSGITHGDVDIISCYDAFTFTTLVQLEAYG